MNYLEIYTNIPINSWYTLVLLVVSEMLSVLLLLILGGDISYVLSVSNSSQISLDSLPFIATCDALTENSILCFCVIPNLLI